jgi:microcystin-dependent protein
VALESATTINQLVTSNPTGADAKGQGDDHIRLIKSTLKNTFPNITGVVTATQAQINALTTPNQFTVPGMILMWSGSLSSLPAGWLLCNGSGTISTGLTVPDLRNRFIVGAGSTYPVRASGGTSTHTHTVTGDVLPTALTLAQMPAHSHTFGQGHVFQGIVGGGLYASGDDMTNTVATNPSTSTVGSGATHDHGLNITVGPAVNHLPPYYALGFIIKD